MITVVIGGSGSGKSEYAERCFENTSQDKIYLATMIASDPESREKVRRHLERRKGRNFRTVECPCQLDRAAGSLPRDCAVLLEGIGTLSANELFLPDANDADDGTGERKKPAEQKKSEPEKPDFDAVKNRILLGIRQLASRARDLVIVSDEVNRAGCEYEGDTRLYQRLVGELNQELCAQADRVVEMVCGCPVVRK